MSYLEAIVLGVIEGVTEFLPVSSTGHLTIAEGATILPIDVKTLDLLQALAADRFSRLFQNFLGP